MGTGGTRFAHFPGVGELRAQAVEFDLECTEIGRQFLVLNELVDAELSAAGDFHPAHMPDRSRNVTDPIENLMSFRLRGRPRLRVAALVNRRALEGVQEANDALDPLSAYRRSFYRTEVAAERPVAAFEGGIA